MWGVGLSFLVHVLRTAILMKRSLIVKHRAKTAALSHSMAVPEGIDDGISPEWTLRRALVVHLLQLRFCPHVTRAGSTPGAVQRWSNGEKRLSVPLVTSLVPAGRQEGGSGWRAASGSTIPAIHPIFHLAHATLRPALCNPRSSSLCLLHSWRP